MVVSVATREEVDLFVGSPLFDQQPTLWVDEEPFCACGHRRGAHAGDGGPMRTTACHHMDWQLNVRCPCVRYVEVPGG